MCIQCNKECKQTKLWSEYTEYPKIFTCYWGRFISCTLQDNSLYNQPDEQIIQNRNKLLIPI